MSAAGEAKPSRGPQGAALRDLVRPTQWKCVSWRWYKEADQ